MPAVGDLSSGFYGELPGDHVQSIADVYKCDANGLVHRVYLVNWDIR